MRPFALAATLLALPAISHAAQASPPSQAPLRAAGDAEARPLFERWLAGYAQAHALVGAFESVGGQEGVLRAAALQADVAAIIAPLSDAQVAAHPHLVDVPVAVSAVAIVYGVLIAGDLRLTPELLDGIFRGRITRWRDPAILSANPGVVLPDLPISVLTQPVNSGDSATLRAYFAHALPAGAGPQPAWTGKVEADPLALIESVRRIDGAIAYLDAAQARRTDLFIASVRNRDGAFVQPAMRSITHAAVGVRLPDDFRASIVDARGLEAYPLASFTHAVISVRLPETRRRTVLDFLRWVLHEGQQHTIALGYAPLPGLVVRALDARLDQLEPRHPRASSP
jgi:phosphate transport system substrate-binding protein